MKALTFSSQLVAGSLLSAALASCGGSQPQVLGGLPSSNITVAAKASSSSSDLLYVVTRNGSVDILSYPGSRLLGKLRTVAHTAAPVTSNPTTGDILIDVHGLIYEWAHGGRKPIAEIRPSPGYGVVDYAFDPTSQDIAVSFQKGSGNGSVGVYQTPSGTPTLYVVPNMEYPGFLGYDAGGNLFVEGRESSNGPDVFAELPRGGSSFSEISLSETLTNMGTVQWDGSYITIASGAIIYQVQISGSDGTIVGQTSLDGAWGRHPFFWIQGNSVIGSTLTKRHLNNGRWLGYWHYPQGGRPYKLITGLNADRQDWMASEAVSVGSK